ncbi:sensor histidine kinase [Campylobacter geochelonis]|uniref:Sensor kinase of two-component regulatory system n=1 Tax=Campylobacter geochelonis TaxID=1780362 RepID=A0A128EBD4_9BACT|nr:sensor histidine kinase [Campylobacter geochelonis]QKF70408.1 Cache sensor-containing two-component system histidine kinase [Campylobacter geochelonis]CZE46280.1 sensor kinase of two-component regulatory system [Campylobacter geochelonis]CZE46352.1 sensor kinase of two-component regulatory system [Campylobacter geochelonis]CZE50705.1 sensor kinase of two-component regulatory system [Campylobacter geochelonis]
MVENFYNNRLFIVFSIIFLSLMAGNYALNRSFVKEILINEQLNILKSSSYRIEKWIENKRLSLQSINSLITHLDSKKDKEAIRDILLQSQAIANFSSVYSGYETGKSISSRNFNEPKNYDPRLRPWYKNTIAQTSTYITKPYADVGLQTSVISICQSIVENHLPKGVLCGILSFNDIKNEILDLRLENNGFLFLIDNELNILLHPNSALELSKAKFDIKNIDLNKTLNYETNDEIITIKPLQNSQLILVAKTLKKNIYHKINIQFLRNFTIYLISAILFIFLGYFYNQRVKREKEMFEKAKQEYEILLFSQTKMAELGQMVGAISHQWIQPLNALGILLGNLVQFKKLGRLNDEIFYDNIDRSLKNIDYMTNTMSIFKNFYKVEEKPQIFDIKEAIDDTIFILFSQHSKIKIRISCKKDIDLTCKNYINEFKQIITCLIQNSKQALNNAKDIKEPKIVISISKEDEFFNVRVIDNAKGIEDGFKDKIFKPFLSTKNSSGLGLYISKLIASKKCGGNLVLLKNKKPTIFLLKIAKQIKC